MPTVKEVWDMFYNLESSLVNRFIVYQVNNEDQVFKAFESLAKKPNATPEDVKQVVEGLLQGAATTAGVGAAAATGGPGAAAGAGTSAGAGAAAGAGLRQVVTCERVQVDVVGAGSDMKMDVELYDGKLPLQHVKEVLATKKLVLTAINGAVPACDEHGYTSSTFAANGAVTVEVSHRPGIKVASAYPASQAWWQRLIRV